MFKFIFKKKQKQNINCIFLQFYKEYKIYKNKHFVFAYMISNI